VVLYNCLVFILIAGVTLPSAAVEMRWGSTHWDHARLIRQGQQSIHFKMVSSESAEAFGDRGQLSPSGSSYQTTQSFTQLGSALGDANAKRFESQLLKEGVDPASTAWTTEFSIDTRKVTSEILWTRGLTSYWMLGVRVPYLQSTTRVSSARVNSTTYQQLQAKYKSGRGKTAQVVLQALSSDELDIETALAANEWEPVRETIEYQGLGDIELMSQVRLMASPSWFVSTRQRVVAPSGRNQDPYTFIRTDAADGQLDLGFDLLVDFRPNEQWVATTMIGYTAQLIDTQAVRVPVEGDSRVEWPIDPDVERDLGDYWLARINTAYRFMTRTWLTGGLEHMRKQKDVYRGSNQSTAQYDLLSAGTDEERSLARLGLRYSSPTWKYSITERSRWSAGIEYITAFEGRNTPHFEATAFEFSVTY
jgi:hypothetical protein